MKTPFQRYNEQWRANEARVRKLMAGEPEFTVDTMRRRAEIGKSQAEKILRHWKEAGVARLHRKVVNEKRYVIAAASPAAEPLPAAPSREGNMWRAMRLLSLFTARDLVAHASVGAVEIVEADAQRYCSALLRSGYLSVSQMADPSIGRLARYRLIQNTGPDAPVLRRVRVLYDPNLEQTHLLGGTPA